MIVIISRGQWFPAAGRDPRSVTWSLTHEHAVQAHVSAEPGLRQKIRQLSTAVSAAGVRVRDAGLLKDSFDENLQAYRPRRSGPSTSIAARSS